MARNTRTRPPHTPAPPRAPCAGDDGYSVVRLPSGEQRKVLSLCTATLGTLSNPQHKNIKLGKAGASRWVGRRPSVRARACVLGARSLFACRPSRVGGTPRRSGAPTLTPHTPLPIHAPCVRNSQVRGVAMNPVDHPHGGGRGKSKGRISQTPWGKPTKGYRTRDNPRTDWAITLPRHKAKR